jgi:excalibur calcium-binding domain-containing protein
MRRLIVATAALAVLLLAGTAPQAHARDKNCSDFSTQKRAQHWFNHHHPGRDPANLDSDNDRIPCEDNPCPCSRKWHRQHGKVEARRTGASARAGHRTKVVCLDEDTYDRKYRFRPHHCIFHQRHEPLAEAFFVRTKHDHWPVWHVRHARGKGKATASMVGTTPVKIRLSHPVTRCGHRVFSKAHFRFPGLGRSGSMSLNTCA